MTSEDNEGQAVERRIGAGRRVHFEALVAVGDERGGFEAESVDLSAEGMRLRTAYLPDIGDRLVFRFDGLGSEVTVEGEVLWRLEETRGGEFAVRFIALEGAALEAVRAMCVGAGSPEPPEGQPTARGTRVRLHIEGLGSPMRARVRGAEDGEVLVGSNLEFLRVGRTLELEDVDHGVRREAYIDSVKVDVDPATSVPQLVVALRYGPPPAKGAARRTVAAHEGSAPALGAALGQQPTPEPSLSDEAQPDVGVEIDAHGAETAHANEADEAVEQGFRGAGAKAARAGMAVAQRVGPALAGAGSRARIAMLGLIATVQRKRAERADARKAAAPRRMTAPPPTGALKSEGRRLVREEETSDEEVRSGSRINKRAAAIGGALGLAAVIAVFAATRMMGPGGRLASSTPALGPAGEPMSAPAVPAPGAAGLAGGAMSAHVPLFGATPLSTTEPVPVAPPDGSSAANEPPPGEEGDGEDPGPGAAVPGPSGGATEFNNGEVVKNATVIRVKMDGPVQGLNGAAGAMGFTVSLPSRRALSNAGELQRKDRRIESLQIVNNAHGADVTVRFKDGIPPYYAKARGDRLEIALGNDKPKDDEAAPAKKKVASKSKKKDGATPKKASASGGAAKKKSKK